MERIIGYKLGLENYKSPQDILDDLVKGYNSLEFSQAKEETFNLIKYYEEQIKHLMSTDPTLEIKEPLKTYGYWGVINKEDIKEGLIKI